MNRLSGRLARVMLSPGVGPTVPLATIERSMPDRLLLLVFSCVSLRVSQIFCPGRSIGGDGVAGRSTACLWAYGKSIVSSNHAKQSIECDDSVGNASESCWCGVCVGFANSVMNGAFGWMVVYRAAELALINSVMRRSGGFDSSKRAGIRCQPV